MLEHLRFIMERLERIQDEKLLRRILRYIEAVTRELG